MKHTIQLSKWIIPVLDLRRFWLGIREYRHYLISWPNYVKLSGAEDLTAYDAFPCLYDRTQMTGIDSHYFYQGVWAMRKIKESGVKEYVGFGL